MKAKTTHIYNNPFKKYISFAERWGYSSLFMMVARHFTAPVILPRLARRCFVFDGKNLDYFYHRYNLTWVTERGIEVPIARNYIETAGEKNTLEVGNVLGHYAKVNHLVVDKFEAGEGVVREDILDYNPGRKFDLIVSVSTFEHIGFEDDGDPDPNKVVAAIAACQKLLTPAGKLVITVPIDYNKSLDQYIEEGRLPNGKQFFFEKGDKMTWRSTDKSSALSRRYCNPFPFANALMVAEFGAKS